MSERASPPCITVVIATCDRPSMLRDRAIASVRAQTRTPDGLVVVDDSPPHARPGVLEVVQGLELPGCRIDYLENSRTPGASGSWNTALDHLFREGREPEHVFVAVLDDEDAWAPTYLERCAALAEVEQLDMVAAGLRRIEGAGAEPLPSAAPAVLRAADFLTGNPGIQGSNLFVRLSVLLAAGGFDEALRSTTDRDLCVRIADLGSVRYGPLQEALVDHFADHDRPRMSTRGSEAKIEGTTAFWRKHAGRMTADQRDAFMGRAKSLFGWSPPVGVAGLEPAERELAKKKALVLGLVANNEQPGELLSVGG